MLAGIYSTLILLGQGIHLYLRFWSSHSNTLRSRYDDWTVLDYVFNFYPGILILLGCLGLVMMKRWAVYLFGVLFAARLYEFAAALFRDVPDDVTHMVWANHSFSLLVAAIAFFYSGNLWRKGILRTGVY